ncbi:MAG: hypothetical protein KAI47_24985, partial [Deltaproteobacteria bacterium]|nr:hypothetical protein [Deltaproteobacteria bacterium]
PGAIGAACDTSDVCDLKNCLRDPTFTGGYCVADCAQDPAVCPEGSICTDYGTKRLCLDTCGEGEACRDGYVCDYGVCRPPCKNASLCKTGDRCQDNHCKAPCKSDSDCTPKRCQDGDCLPPCTKDGDCLPGEQCDTAKGQCKSRPGKPLGAACSKPGPGDECSTHYCLPSRKICSIQCQGSSDCPSGSWVCGLEKLDQDENGTIDGAVAACIPKKGPGQAAAPCQKDTDCASNHCYNGFCLEGCAQDANCAKDQSCASVKLILQAAIAPYKGCLPRVGHGEYTLGTFTDNVLHGFDIPSTAESFALITQTTDPNEIPLIAQLLDPNQATVFENTDQCSYYAQPNRYLYSQEISSALVPNTSTVKIVPGIYSYLLTSSKPGIPITVKLILTFGKKNAAKIDVNWVFLNLSGTCIPGAKLNAASAPKHTWFLKMRSQLTTVLKPANLTLGDQTYHDLNDPSLDIITMSNTASELPKLFSSTKGMKGRALNIFFVRDIQISGGGADGIILGISGGIPGPPGIHGTINSGLAMSMQTACFEKDGYRPGDTLAHEMGHYLGLFHNMEAPTNPGYDEGQKKVICPCPCGKNLVCQYGSGNTKWCRGLDHLPDTTNDAGNLMFYAADNAKNFDGNKLTTTQIRVMLNSPLVKP